MMTKKKTWIALFALLIMVFAMSASASAASSKTVAKIGSKKYSSLQKALNSVKKGQTIKLTKNVTLTGANQLTFKKNVKYTLNLNKKTIKSFSVFMNKGNVTIKNGTISACGLYIQKSVRATFQNVKVTAPKGYSSTTIHMSSKPSLTLNKCTMTKTRIEPRDKSKLTISDGKYASIWNYGTGTVTINGGTFQQIYNEAKGKTVINNAAINNKDNKNGYPLGVGAGTMTIKNMTCNSVSACLIVDSGAILKISGGTFTTTTTVGGTVLNNAGTAILNGGTYITKNTNDIDEGIWNSGKLTIGSNAKLVNCGVVEAQ